MGTEQLFEDSLFIELFTKLVKKDQETISKSNHFNNLSDSLKEGIINGR